MSFEIVFTLQLLLRKPLPIHALHISPFSVVTKCTIPQLKHEDESLVIYLEDIQSCKIAGKPLMRMSPELETKVHLTQKILLSIIRSHCTAQATEIYSFTNTLEYQRGFYLCLSRRVVECTPHGVMQSKTRQRIPSI